MGLVLEPWSEDGPVQAYAQAFLVLAGSGSLYYRVAKRPDATKLQAIIAWSDDRCVNTPISTPVNAPMLPKYRHGRDAGERGTYPIRACARKNIRDRRFFLTISCNAT